MGGKRHTLKQSDVFFIASLFASTFEICTLKHYMRVFWFCPFFF